MRRLRFQDLVVLVVLCCTAGCAGSPPEQTGLMKRLDIEASRRELQIMMYAYGSHFAGQVELAADRIYTETADPDVREAAILWKLNAIPVMLQSCFANDPAMGMIGATLFAVQMLEYFETGNGRNAFGPHQQIAIETSREMLEELRDVVRMTWDERTLEQIAPKVRDLAAQYPIRNQLFVREAFVPRLAKQIAGDVKGGLGAAGAMHEQMLALTDRANVMTALLPRQVQWQSQLLLAQGESLVATRLDSAFTDLHPFLEYVSEERRQVTKDLGTERAAILTGIASERLAVLEVLAQERAEILAALANERNLTLQELNKLTLTAIREIVAESQTVADHTIDRIYRRSLQLLAVPALVCLILVIIVIILVRNAINRMPEHRRPL